MLQFVNPILLLAGAGIIIPVIIHLWNIRKGKVLRIGSTILMAEATQKKSSSLRLSQWLLLLIRCLFIVFLAMLLAGPEWRQPKEQTGKGWVLIDKQEFRLIYHDFKSPIDSLLSEGYTLHSADESLEKINLADSAAFADTEDPAPQRKLSYWSVLARADKTLPAGYPVYFFTSDRLRNATGYKNAKRPLISIDLRWQMTTIDTTYKPLAVSSRQLAAGGFQLTSFLSGPDGGYYIRNTAQQPGAAYPLTDTTTLAITIYHNKFPEDLRYLQAAIRAIADFGNYKLALRTVSQVNDIPGSQQDWIFWLSNEPQPDNLSAKNVFVYAAGTSLQNTSWIVSSDGPVAVNVINTYQQVPGNSAGKALVWKDGFGNPLLTMETNHRGPANQNLYRFYSRFHPAWSDLGWDPDFPKLLFPMIVSDRVSETTNAYDYLRTEAADMIPTVVRETYKENKSSFDIVELSKLFWLVSFLLFATERILSLNPRHRKSS